MNDKMKIETTLVSDNNKRFAVGDDISFVMVNNTGHHDKYIGRIEQIGDGFIVIDKIEINRERISGNMTIDLTEIKKGSCEYVAKS